MGQVNGRRESRALESDSELSAQVQGAQPSAKNGRIPRLFRADDQAKRVLPEGVLAEGQRFELSVQIRECGGERGALAFQSPILDHWRRQAIRSKLGR